MRLSFYLRFSRRARTGKSSPLWSACGVVVSEVSPPYYIGRLTNSPGTIEGSDFYLQLDSEVPFMAPHVLDIDHPPPEYLDALFSEPPKNRWPRA